MKRVIKFRHYREDYPYDKVMEYDTFHSFLDTHRIDEGQIVHAEKYNIGGDSCTDIEECNCTIMQYTCINDKNGKEIYEGDILTDGKLSMLRDSTCIFIVEQRSGYYVLKTDEYSEDVGKYQFYKLHEVDTTKLEVIGNIHENKELL